MDSFNIPRRRVLGGLAGLGAASFLSGCGISIAASDPVKPTLNNPQPTPSGALTAATLTVTTGTAGTIPANFAGLSYGKTELSHPFFRSTNTALLALFKLIGPNLLRIGGSPADIYTWIPNGPGQTYRQITMSDVDAFAAFVKASGWRVLYSVNLGGSAYPIGSPGYTTPALAAAEVAYVTAKLGSSLYGIEIGNEPDSYGNTDGPYPGNWTLAQYETLWNQYRTAILATTPSAFITGPAGGHLATWAIPFTKDQTIAKVGLLTDHYYQIAGTVSDGTLTKLMNYPDPTLVSNLGLMSAAQAITGIPFRIAECNSESASGTFGVSDSYGSALWVLDFLYTCALGGAVGVNLEGGQGVAYSPIGDDETNVTSVQPEFYGMLMFALVGSGTLLQNTFVAGGLKAGAYAVRTTAGGLNLVITNRDVTQNLNLTVQLPQTVNYANLIAMTQLSSGASGPSLGATSGVMIQGAGVGLDGTFVPGTAYRVPSTGNTITCYVPALSAVILQVY